jgi:hypothetical protein
MGVQASGRWQISDADLLQAIADLEVEMRQQYSVMLGLISEMDTRGVAKTLGHSATAALLSQTLRITRGEANQRVAHAIDLHATTTPTGSVVAPALPRTAEALARGVIGPEHIQVIRKTMKALKHLSPEKRACAEDHMVAQAADDDDPKALERFGDRVKDIVDPDGVLPPDQEPKQPARKFSRRTFRDGHSEFWGRLDRESTNLLDELMKPFNKPHSDVEGPDTRSADERAGDAFAEVLRQAANSPDLPVRNGVRTEVAFTISYDDLKGALADQILPDNIITAREARLLACDCHILPAVLGTNSQPLDVAVPAYVVPAHIRRALVLRDKGCAFPGCDRPASVTDAHHIWSWLQGGPTKVDNLVLLCSHHHRLIHRSEWTVELINDTAYFTPPTYIDPNQRKRRNTLHRA